MKLLNYKIIYYYIIRHWVESMIIRDFILSDLNDVVKIEFEAFDDPYPVGVLMQLYEAGAGFLVAQVAQTIVGYIIFWIKEGKGHIIVIAVDSKYQNMQVGSLLLEKACFIFKRNNINKVFLEVRKSNTNAIRFYKKNGFIKIDEEEDYYDDGESAIIMQYSNYEC